MTTPDKDRYGLKRFINRYNLHSYDHLQCYRSIAATNLLMDIANMVEKKHNDRLKLKRFPALPDAVKPKLPQQ